MRKRKRKAWRNDCDTALLRAFPAPATKATFARDGKKPRFFECVVPPVRGWENLPRKKYREQKSPSFTAHFFAEQEFSEWLRPTHKIFLPSTGGFINRKTVELGRAEGIERVEDLGPEPRNLG